jgi:hypothetical protein
VFWLKLKLVVYVVENIGGSYRNMVLRRMVFCWVISKVVLRMFPVDVELFLSLAVTQPVETHIHSFGSALDYIVSEDANGAFVVKLERCGSLGMAHFSEGCMHGDGIFGVDESGASFGLLDGCHDGVNDFAVDEDWCIEWWRGIVGLNGDFGLVGEIEIAAVGRAACFAFVDVGSVSVEPEVHFRSFVLDAGVGMGGGIVKKMVDPESNVGPGAGGDGRGNGADGGLYGVVDGSGIVIEEPGEFLTAFELSWCELTNIVGAFCKLLFLSVGWGCIGVRGVLLFRG